MQLRNTLLSSGSMMTKSHTHSFLQKCEVLSGKVVMAPVQYCLFHFSFTAVLTSVMEVSKEEQQNIDQGILLEFWLFALSVGSQTFSIKARILHQLPWSAVIRKWGCRTDEGGCVEQDTCITFLGGSQTLR